MLYQDLMITANQTPRTNTQKMKKQSPQKTPPKLVIKSQENKREREEKRAEISTNAY